MWQIVKFCVLYLGDRLYRRLKWIRVSFVCAHAPVLTLQTIQGPLQLSGTGRWTGARLRFTGEASAAEGSEAALNNLLNVIGRRSGPRSVISIG